LSQALDWAHENLNPEERSKSQRAAPNGSRRMVEASSFSTRDSSKTSPESEVDNLSQTDVVWGQGTERTFQNDEKPNCSTIIFRTVIAKTKDIVIT
jgi:hypothetical protein